MSDIDEAIPLRRVKGVRGWARLDDEIAHIEARLAAFAESDAYDAGERLVMREAYLLGLERARQWIKQEPWV